MSGGQYKITTTCQHKDKHITDCTLSEYFKRYVEFNGVPIEVGKCKYVIKEYHSGPSDICNEPLILYPHVLKHIK